MRNSKHFLLLILLILSSCGGQQPERTDITFPENKTSLTSTFSNTIIKEATETSLSFNTIITSPSQQILIETNEDAENEIIYQEIRIEGVFEIVGWYNGFALDMNLTGIREEFIKLVDEKKYEEWLNKFKNDNYYDVFKRDSDHTDLNDYKNVYSFSRYFGLSEEQIRNSIYETDEKGETDLEIYNFTEEQIETLCNGTKAEVIREFAYPETVIKGDKFYSPAWFYYHSVEEYKQAGIELEDIIKSYNALFYQLVERYIFEYNPYVFDRILQNIYEFTDGDSSVNYKELCGYDRDFSVPFMRYYTNIDEKNVLLDSSMYRSYVNFYNRYYEDKEKDKVTNITKGEETYSPHWIYYNKVEAYKNAGITPTELNEMLPRYKELGVLTSEAFEALKAKIERYNKEYEKMD